MDTYDLAKCIEGNSNLTNSKKETILKDKNLSIGIVYFFL
jgi:hypothetical protein